MAVEGIPALAIARVTGLTPETVNATIGKALARGVLLRLPPQDWIGEEAQSGQVRDARHHARERTVPLPNAVDQAEAARAVMALFGTSFQEACFLACLMRLEEAGKPTLLQAISTMPDCQPKLVDVVACKLRKRLRPHGLGFETLFGVGYFLTPEQRMAVADRLAAAAAPPSAPRLATAA